MQAYSMNTGNVYESWEALERAEVIGYSPVVVFKRTNSKGNVRIHTNVVGLYETQAKAKGAADRLRAKIKKAMADPNRHFMYDDGTELVCVNTERVWRR